jgi:hypothetical protein
VEKTNPIQTQSKPISEKLFIGQNKPLVVVTPIYIIPGIAENGIKMCTTRLSVINHTGFEAKNTVIDCSYGGNVWISAWVQAEIDRKEKEGKNVGEKGVVKGQYYPSLSKKNSIQLLTHNKGMIVSFTGQLDLEKQVSSKGKEGYPVLVRVKWENDRGSVFEEIHKYKLISTMVGEGRHFTFIPEGVISQKNMEIIPGK